MNFHNSLLSNDMLIALAARLSKAISGLITDQLKKSNIDLTKSQTIILSILVFKNKCAQCDLALITERDATSLTRMLSTMERKGLILRQQSKHDRRIKEVSISAFGKKQFELAKPIVQKIISQSEINIDKGELVFAKNIILKIYNNLNFKYEQ